MFVKQTVCNIDIARSVVNTMRMKGDNNGVYLDFGRRFKVARDKNNVTQNEVAKRVGLSRTSITNIECGRQQVSLHVFLSLSKAVGVEPQQLLPNIDLICADDGKLKAEVKKQKLSKYEEAAVMRSIAKLKGEKA